MKQSYKEAVLISGSPVWLSEETDSKPEKHLKTKYKGASLLSPLQRSKLSRLACRHVKDRRILPSVLFQCLSAVQTKSDFSSSEILSVPEDVNLSSVS